MNRKYLILTILIFNFTVSQGLTQNVDSLKLRLKTEKNPKKRVEILSNLSEILDRKFSTDSINLDYYHQLIGLGRQVKDSVTVAKGWYYIGWYYYLKDEIVLSNKSYYNALQSLSNSDKEFTLKAQLYNQLGINYSDLQAYRLALKNYRLTLDYLEKENDAVGKASTLTNLTSVFHRMNMADSAKYYAELSLTAYKLAAKETSDTTYGIEGMGIAYFELDSINKAIDYLKRALNFGTIKKDTVLLSSASKYLGYSYFKQKNFKKSKYHLLFFEKLSLVKSHDVYQYLSDIYFSEGDYKMALYYYQEKVKLNEVVFGPLIREQVFEAQQYYQDGIRDRVVLKAQNQALKSRQYNYVLLSSLVFTLMTLFFISYMYRQKRRTGKVLLELNKEIAAQNEEITAQSDKLREANEEVTSINTNLDRLVKERTAIVEYQRQQIEYFAFMNAHEIRGPLSTILGLLNIIEDENLLKDNKQIEHYLRKTAVKMDIIIHKVQDELNNEDWKKIKIEEKK